MPQNEFDLPPELWRKKVEKMLLQHHADIQRLWKRQGERSRDYIGELPHAADAFQTSTTTDAGE